MIVSSPGHYLVAVLEQSASNSPNIEQDLLLICDEFLALGLFQGNRNTSNGVVMRPTLQAREHSSIDLLLQVVLDILALGALVAACPVEN